MTTELEAILHRIPVTQHAIARLKIETADKNGWTEIDLCTPDDAVPHHYDLVGISPFGGRKLLPEA